jgi:hypothetical protein
MRSWYPASTGARTAGHRRRTGGLRRALSRYDAVRGTRVPGGFQWPRDAAYGEERASAGGRPWVVRSADAEVGRRAGTRDVAARRRPGPNRFAGPLFEIKYLQNLL